VNGIFGGVRTNYRVKNGQKSKSMIDCLRREDVSELQEIEDTSLDPSSHVQKVYNATFFGSQKCG